VLLALSNLPEVAIRLGVGVRRMHSRVGLVAPAPASQRGNASSVVPATARQGARNQNIAL